MYWVRLWLVHPILRRPFESHYLAHSISFVVAGDVPQSAKRSAKLQPDISKMVVDELGIGISHTSPDSLPVEVFITLQVCNRFRSSVDFDFGIRIFHLDSASIILTPSPSSSMLILKSYFREFLSNAAWRGRIQSCDLTPSFLEGTFSARWKAASLIRIPLMTRLASASCRAPSTAITSIPAAGSITEPLTTWSLTHGVSDVRMNFLHLASRGFLSPLWIPSKSRGGVLLMAKVLTYSTLMPVSLRMIKGIFQ